MPELTTQEAVALTAKLAKRLDERTPRIEKFERYYEGKHNLRFATRKYREAFGALFREFAQNWCGVVVDSTVERMHVEGFRFPLEEEEAGEQENPFFNPGSEPPPNLRDALVATPHPLGSGALDEQFQLGHSSCSNCKMFDAVHGACTGYGNWNVKPNQTCDSWSPVAGAVPTEPGAEGGSAAVGAAAPTVAPPTPEVPISPLQAGDEEAWDLWQRNNLDLYSDIAHETMMVTGHAYILVGPREDDPKNEHPLMTIEHPLEVITQHAPGDVKRITAALKRWYDEETGHAYATLYTPDTVYKWEGSTSSTDVRPVGKQHWVPREGEPHVPNPFKNGVVPVVPLINRQKLNGNGRSELLDIIPIQDAVNKLTSDMLVAAEFAAFRQRILTGMEIPEDEHGNIIPDFDLKASINRLLVVKDDNVKVHEFGVTDLANYVQGIEHLRDAIAAISRTPPQYLVGQVVNVSGEALKAAESGQVQKAKRRCRFAGEGWESAMRLAFLLKGDTERAEAYDAETIWGNPEILTESSMADSLAKWAGLGVPRQALWERGGASQTEIKRWLQMKLTEPEEPKGMPTALAAMIAASRGAGG